MDTKVLNPVLQDVKIRELQKKKLSFDEFTKMQKVVKEMLKAFPIKDKDNWIAVSGRFKYLMGKSFPDSRDIILGSRSTTDLIVLASKISKNRPEVYLIFYKDNGEFKIFDEAMFDAYSDKTFQKPDWSAFWPLI